jgi:hypothetical protein
MHLFRRLPDYEVLLSRVTDPTPHPALRATLSCKGRGLKSLGKQPSPYWERGTAKRWVRVLGLTEARHSIR